MSTEQLRYLLDSDVFIDYSLRREPSTQLLNQLMAEGIGLSIFSYGEVIEGTFRRPHFKSTRTFLTTSLTWSRLFN